MDVNLKNKIDALVKRTVENMKIAGLNNIEDNWRSPVLREYCMFCSYLAESAKQEGHSLEQILSDSPYKDAYVYMRECTDELLKKIDVYKDPKKSEMDSSLDILEIAEELREST